MKATISITLFSMFGAALATASPAADTTPANARELGLVRWGRELDAAAGESNATGKPIAILFQEVPGCATCVGFGETALSHPLVVEALESEFIPVLVYNNRSGRDAEILKRFGEPAWNNPVVRFVDASERDVIPRRDGVWSTSALAARMAGALRAAGRTVPRYLELVASEGNPPGAETATFAMRCFWSGEACLGEIDGVIASRAGFLEGREAVELTFDPARCSYARLLERVKGDGCADLAFAHDDDQEREARRVFGDRVRRVATYATDAPDSDQKYYVAHSMFRELALTPVQAARLNAALGRGGDGAEWLSPRQIAQARATQTDGPR
ncbi:MAG: VPGUxxT family thioredoxin-like (seleno)protein, type 2 [bacterium]